MLINGVSIDAEHADRQKWPFTIPAVQQLLDNGLRLTSNIVVFVGENGSGKSTVLEAIAEAYGLDIRGGHGARVRGNPEPETPLGQVLRLSRTAQGWNFVGYRKTKGFFLRAETAFDMLGFMTAVGVDGYGEESWKVSHGESYLHAIQGRFTGGGLYLLDEAEGPLSFHSTLALLYHLVSLASAPDVQVIYSTHSPLVAAIPGAQIIEFGVHGIREAAWEELETTNLWRAFLGKPGKFFDEDDVRI